eukprot:evm.model.scf_623.3 EVM.evm.TU.scf_623.3   scf_623:40751-46770(+)
MGFGCPCAHEADCPCHPDDSWLKAGVCPKCPVFGCLECDPLKCDECKMCEPGAILSTDRKTCSCASCEVTGCAECDAEECDRCLVCGQGYELTVDRKCDWSECLVEHCEKCDPLNRYKCDTCNPFLVLSSDRKSCGCPECAIAGCEKCDPQKCDECLVCAGNEVPSADRSACGCECSISHCAVCGKDCDTCDKCDYGYEVFGDGAACKCDRCEVPHCKECDPEDCLSCWACDAGYTFPAPVLSQRDFQDFAEYPPDHPGSTCICGACGVAGCEECDPEDCGRCKKCVEGMEPDREGVCRCAGCGVDYCAQCSSTQCGVCEECAVYHELGWGGKSCECNCRSIVGCKEGACDENCRCNECYPPLQTSSCGYCLLGQSEPGCDWMWVDAKDDLSCADTCARRGANFPAAVNAAQEVNGPVNASVNASAVYPCFADIKGQEGIRPGQNIEEHTSSKAICNTEYNSQGLSGVWSDYRSKNSTSFFCVCQTESMPLRWVSKKVGQSTSQRVGQLTESEADGCREVCGTQGLFPIAFPGSHAHSRGRKMEFAVCRVKDSEHGTRERYSAKYYEGGVHAAMYSAGYNVQSEVWAGLCMTPTTFSKQYDCLCANDCHEADCGDVDRWSLGMDRSQIHG